MNANRVAGLAQPSPVTESIDSLTLLRGGLQSIRRAQTFSAHRRVLTASRIIRDP